MSFERLPYDQCAYVHRVRESMGPGRYHLGKPQDDIGPVGGTVRPDNHVIAQRYGRGVCQQGANVDAENTLLNITQPVSHCNEIPVVPPAGCKNRDVKIGRDLYNPTEDTRLSNPSCTLRGAGINRFHALCSDPQAECAVLARFPIGTSSRIVVKDNHVACILKQYDNTRLNPSEPSPSYTPEGSVFNFRPNQTDVPSRWFDDGFRSVQTGRT